MAWHPNTGGSAKSYRGQRAFRMEIAGPLHTSMHAHSWLRYRVTDKED